MGLIKSRQDRTMHIRSNESLIRHLDEGNRVKYVFFWGPLAAIALAGLVLLGIVVVVIGRHLVEGEQRKEAQLEASRRFDSQLDVKEGKQSQAASFGRQDTAKAKRIASMRRYAT